MNTANYLVELFGEKGDRNGRLQNSKWGLLIFVGFFNIYGIYALIDLTPGEITTSSVLSIIVKNFIIPILFFSVGWLWNLSFWQRWFTKFKTGIVIKKHTLFWNNKGLSWAFILLLFAILLQVMAIWGDKTWDKTDIEGADGHYTQTELESMKGVRGAENGIVQLRRQLNLGVIATQVGEFVKIFFMIFAAKLLVDLKMKNQFRFCPQFFVLLFFAIFPVVFLAYIMPNKSMMVIFFLLLMLMIWVQKKMSFPLRILVMIIPIAAIVLLTFAMSNLDSKSPLLNKYYIKRVWTYFNYEEALENANKAEKEKIKDITKQQSAAKRAIINGGFFGKGHNNSTTIYVLSQSQNDFVFSILCEELGLLQMLPFCIVFPFFLWFCFYTPLNLKVTNERGEINEEALFAQNSAWGIAFIFALNFLIHIGVNLALLPPTGQPLPFVSFGGTNLSMNYFLMGMLVQISAMKQERIV